VTKDSITKIRPPHLLFRIILNVRAREERAMLIAGSYAGLDYSDRRSRIQKRLEFFSKVGVKLGQFVQDHWY